MQKDTFVELDCIQAEVCSDNNEELAQPAAAATPSTADAPPSTVDLPPPHHSQELLTITQFWKNYNIKNAVDRTVNAWWKINHAFVVHAWKPSLGTTMVGEAGDMQCEAATSPRWWRQPR